MILITRLIFHIKQVRQVLRLCKVFANNSSGNIKLSKAQLSIILHYLTIYYNTFHDVLTGNTTPETLAIKLIENNKDIPKSEKDAPFF